MAGTSADLGTLYAESDGLALAELVRKREVSPLELFEAAAAAIAAVNPKLNAVVHELYDIGRAAAATVQPDAPFAGVPYLLKESGTEWEGAPNTSASHWLRHNVAKADAEVVKRIKAAGFLLMGKSNAPENGWSISTEPKLYGATLNPWRQDVTPGGSSGGSAAGVAARLVPVAEASDGAGSIRVPASCCGLVGLKPSRGRVSPAPSGDALYGCAYDLCVSRSVRDTAAYLDAVSGPAPGDLYFAPPAETDWLTLSKRPPEKLRIGFSLTPPDGFPVHPEVEAAMRRTLAVLQRLGHEVEEHDMAASVADIWWPYVRIIATATAHAFSAREALAGAPATEADVEPLTWAIRQRGLSVSGAQHSGDLDAIRVAGRQICADLAAYDVFVTPTLTQPPRPLGYYDMSMTDIDAYNAKWTDAAFMYPFNLSGQPAISLPLHWSTDGLPIGVQLVGRFADEATLLRLSTVLETEMPWRDRRPPLSA